MRGRRREGIYSACMWHGVTHTACACLTALSGVHFVLLLLPAALIVPALVVVVAPPVVPALVFVVSPLVIPPPVVVSTH